MKIQNITPQHILSDSELTCFVIPALFSKEECEHLLSNNIKDSFQKAIANYPTYYRNNERFVMDNVDLANQLFQKVKPYLPEVITTNSQITSENGIWHLKELNKRLRFCKYSANQYFHRHLDGVHYQNHVTQSKLTFMIYLNGSEEFTGGRTLFFKTKETEEIWASYIPAQGDLIVFDHNVWHEGEVLQKGEKFVLRSDILYSKKEDEICKGPFVGHLGYIWSLCKFNNSTFLSGGRDKEIKVWSIAGEPIITLKGHQNSILCIEKINDQIFVSGSRDKQIIVWKNFQLSHKINIHTAIVLSICRLDDFTFASGSGDNTIKLATLDGTILKTYSEHTNWVWQVIKIDTHIIASCSEDGTIKIWNCTFDNSLSTIKTDYPIISIAYNKHARQLISGNLKGEITIHTLGNDYFLKEKRILKAHKGIIRVIKIIDNQIFATGGEDNKVKIWNWKGQLISEHSHNNFVQSIEKLDSKSILSASYDGTIQSCDFAAKL